MELVIEVKSTTRGSVVRESNGGYFLSGNVKITTMEHVDANLMAMIKVLSRTNSQIMACLTIAIRRKYFSVSCFAV